MMEKDRNKRYKDAHHLIQDLEAIYRNEPPLIARQAVDASVLAGPRAANTNQTQLTIIIVMGIALAVSLLGNLFFLLR
jgi:hypothetical protein